MKMGNIYFLKIFTYVLVFGLNITLLSVDHATCCNNHHFYEQSKIVVEIYNDVN